MQDQATFAGGCFWCTEAVFQRVKGVIKVEPGYSGGTVDHPSYQQVSTGTTGHQEAIQITYNPTEISYSTLLQIFFATHDSTTLDRQGADFGPQYRSVIFYHSPDQKSQAEVAKSTISNSVTEIRPFKNFHPAEKYHLNYYNNNQSAPYCQVIINPKIQKLLTHFPSLTTES